MFYKVPNTPHYTKNEFFHQQFLQYIRPNPLKTADFVIFTEKILQGKLQFLCSTSHCVKSARTWSYSGPYFSTFGLNTERYGMFLTIQSKCGKIRTRITPNTDTFYAFTQCLISRILKTRDVSASLQLKSC